MDATGAKIDGSILSAKQELSDKYMDATKQAEEAIGALTDGCVSGFSGVAAALGKMQAASAAGLEKVQVQGDELGRKLDGQPANVFSSLAAAFATASTSASADARVAAPVAVPTGTVPITPAPVTAPVNMPAAVAPSLPTAVVNTITSGPGSPALGSPLMPVSPSAHNLQRESMHAAAKRGRVQTRQWQQDQPKQPRWR